MTEAEWLDSGYPILTFESEWGWPSPRKQRLFAVACCLSIEHLFPKDRRWQECLDLAEHHADRKVKRTQLSSTFTNIKARWKRQRQRVVTYADMCAHFVTSAVEWACETQKRNYAAHASIAAACAAAYAVLPQDGKYIPPAYSPHDRCWQDAEKAEVRRQIDFLRHISGDPFHPVKASIGQVPRPVALLAQAAYNERLVPSGNLDPNRLAALSDALDKADCADAAILSHLRSAVPHPRGCWALDLLLKKK